MSPIDRPRTVRALVRPADGKKLAEPLKRPEPQLDQQKGQMPPLGDEAGDAPDEPAKIPGE